MRVLALGLVLLSASAGCRERGGASTKRVASATASPSASARAVEIERALAALRREETSLRARTDFERLPPSSRSLGASPYALLALPTGTPLAPGGTTPRLAGLLRGDSRVVLLSADLRELAGAPAPRSPSSLAALPDGRLLVVGPLDRRLARYAVQAGRLVEDGSVPLQGARVPRALAADERSVVVADFARDALGTAPVADAAAKKPAPIALASPTCRGPFRVALTPRFAGVLCLFDHAVALHERSENGAPGRELARITHDGPLWGFALLPDGDGLLVAAGGVENHPLDRRDKAFGYVDSFAYLYRVTEGKAPERLLELNTAALGVVTPKGVVLERRDDAGLLLTVVGSGSDRRLELDLEAPRYEPRPRVLPSLPGCAEAARVDGRLVCASSLFDAWVELTATPRAVPARAPAAGDPSAAERLGEALFFTTLMAPEATSEGRRSRFTCETCHFEGGTDGRVHHSGRDDIRVSTRPLFGLFNDAPHFSRARDQDLTAVCHNEFKVASRGNPVDSWFSLEPSRFPWLAALGVQADLLSPEKLRGALLAFLSRFSHEESPFASGREQLAFTDVEQRGASLFRERCASCHAARLIADDATTEVPFERWPSLVLSPSGPVVWARGDYEKVGVLPYVDPQGTRIPSLRRLYLKRPYLTRGTARTLGDLLAAVRFSDREFFHVSLEARPELRSLTSSEREDLLAFLELL